MQVKNQFLVTLEYNKIFHHQKNFQYLLMEIYKVYRANDNEVFQFFKILLMNLKVVSIYQPKTHTETQFYLVLNP